MFAGTAYLSTSELHKTRAFIEKLDIGDKLGSFATSKSWFLGFGEGYSQDLIIVCRLSLLINCELMYAPSKAVLKAAADRLVSDMANVDADTKAGTSDVTLLCGDGARVPAHKLTLASRSDVFAAMFRHKGYNS